MHDERFTHCSQTPIFCKVLHQNTLQTLMVEKLGRFGDSQPSANDFHHSWFTMQSTQPADVFFAQILLDSNPPISYLLPEIVLYTVSW